MSLTITSSRIASQAPRNIYAVDPNNDGIPDLVRDNIQLPNGFSIELANGDGTFRPRQTYQFSGQHAGTIPMVAGDFNGDGNADSIFELSGSNQVAVFFGKGDGTLQAPLYETIALPSSQYFGGDPIAAADFNGDGHNSRQPRSRRPGQRRRLQR